ncbi:MAG: DNA polymerase-3 subunit gamma/tau [Cellvibrionaceae bacterium]|jgi:DNA polymerase-3 subunit gamma/tau
MSQALYRKYRPARFDQVVGQEHVTQTLRNSVFAERVGHAYLFCGPRGTGKTTTARLVAKAVNCENENLAERPCDNCRICHAVNEGRFMDLIEIDAASNTGVDDIRDLREKINFSPAEGRKKVYIIDEVHMLSTAAFNALLKTLEEPPPHALFVLATTEEHKVPMTIKSRCQQFNFRLLSIREIIDRLKLLVEREGLNVEESVFSLVAQHGAGSLRDAESLLDQLIGAPDEQITLDRAQAVLGTAASESVANLSEAILTADGQKGLAIIHESLSVGADARQFARQIVSYLRTLLLLQTAGKDVAVDLPAAEKEAMLVQAQQGHRRTLIQAIKNFTEAATAPSTSWQTQLPLELAFIDSLPAGLEPAAVLPPPIQVQVPPKVEPVIVPTANSKPNPKKEEIPVTRKSVKPKDDPAPQPTANLDHESFQISEFKGKKWREFTAQAGQANRNYKTWLASARPLAFEGSTLVLGFDLEFLLKKIGAETQEIGKILSQVMAAECFVKCVMNDEYSSPGIDSSKEFSKQLKDIAEEVGGVVRDS